MASLPKTARQTKRKTTTEHEGFLRHAGFRWLRIAIYLSLLSLAGYLLADGNPHPNGGTWYGYTLGTLGAGLIVWLAMLGVRKRKMSEGAWSLKAWTSAHVYLGLSLIVIATLHTGFKFGWNVHTLAYVLMMLVIASGVYGIVAYSTLPKSLSDNRAKMTAKQMLEELATIDRQIYDGAQPLARAHADLVLAALDEGSFSGSFWARITGDYPDSATQTAIEGLGGVSAGRSGDAAIDRVAGLLRRRSAQLEQIRRQLRVKALLEVWLFIHVPLTFALLAALFAHIISVFYYW